MGETQYTGMGGANTPQVGMGVGAAAGSFIPGVGTVAGAGAGYMAGKLLQGSKYYMPGYQGGDWTASDADRQMQLQSREQQNALGGMLMEQAQGRGPSVAQNQLRAGQAQNVAAMNSQAASASGGAMNRMMAQGQAINAGAAAGQQATGQAATMRAQEQLGAMGQLQGLYGQQRQQDLGAQREDQTRQLESSKNFNDAEANRVRAVGDASKNDAGILNTAANFFSSDIRMKKNISPVGDDEMSALLDHLVPRKFRYREESEESPLRIGIMAQDVEDAPGGRALVGKDADGMRFIRGPAALGTMLAALGEIHDRISQLEGGRHHAR